MPATIGPGPALRNNGDDDDNDVTGEARALVATPIVIATTDIETRIFNKVLVVTIVGVEFKERVFLFDLN
jgi:hypothetical protein